MAIELIETLLFNSYQFLASIKVPGFDLSIIQLMFGAMGAIISISFLKIFFGIGNPGLSASGFIGSFKQRGGNNQKINISKQRRGDTK